MKTQKVKKVTKATLKAYIRKGELFYKIKSSFDGTVDGFSERGEMENYSKMTLKELNNFWMHSNGLYLDDKREPIQLYNCCFNMDLKIIKGEK